MIKQSVQVLITAITQKILPLHDDARAAQQEAWWLIEHVTGLDKAALIARQTITLSNETHTSLKSSIHDRVHNHKPLQYIIGTVPFCSLTLTVHPPILIPRPETEQLCLWLIETLKPIRNNTLSILDVCCGSGCITLALAATLPHAHVTGVDLNPKAIELCRHNQKRNQITNATFIESDLYTALPSGCSFDIIIANPPYVSKQEWEHLSEEVTQWEDQRALVAPDDGLAFYTPIIKQGRMMLDRKTLFTNHMLPRMIVEIGNSQAKKVYELFQKNGFVDIVVHRDFSKRNRWISACAGEKK